MRTPIFDSLEKYANSKPISFYMPGHKGGVELTGNFKALLSEIDVTEIPGADNLHFPEGIIQQAQDLAAKAFGAQHTFFLINGSTSGIHAAIMAVCRRGDKLLLSRNCHKSVITGVFLAGAHPLYMKPEFEESFGISTVMLPQEVEKMLIAHPDITGVVITSPNFYGVCSNIRQIADIVHKYEKILMVDEAHGAHLKFSSKLPECALESGADIAIQSAHKTLPALTQASYLHLNSTRIDIEKLKFYLSSIQSSSPSYILMASLDIARSIMETDGAKKLEDLIQHIEWFKEKVLALGNYKILSKSNIEQGYFDVTRLVINVRELGLTGYEADDFLRSKFNIQVEMSDISNIVCICSIGNRKEEFERFLVALESMLKNKKPVANPALLGSLNFSLPQEKVSLSDAIHAKNKRIALEKSNGAVSARMIVPYPPGIPLVCPGEVIDEEVILYINKVMQMGGKVNGISGDNEVTVLV